LSHAGSATAPANFPYNTTALFAGSGEWVKKKDMPEALSDHAAVGIPHEIAGYAEAQSRPHSRPHARPHARTAALATTGVRDATMAVQRGGLDPGHATATSLAGIRRPTGVFAFALLCQGS
jgi:hypothetical protein